MEQWKHNARRNTIWKKEEAILKLSKKTEAYKDFDKNSSVVKILPKNAEIIYRELILVNQHVWVECVSPSENFYIPIRRWNGQSPYSKKYKLSELKHTILDLKKDKPMTKKVENGIDIYIDRDKEIMYVSMNQKMTYESQKRLKESINVIKGYQVMVFDYINDIKFLN